MSTYLTYDPVKMTRFEMLAPPEWLKALDDWRREQPDLPGRAEAIRRLVSAALSAEKPADKSKARRVPRPD